MAKKSSESADEKSGEDVREVKRGKPVRKDAGDAADVRPEGLKAPRRAKAGR